MPRHQRPTPLAPTRRQLLQGVAVAGGGLAAWSLAPSRAIATTTYPGTPTIGQYSITTTADMSAVAKMGMVVLLPHEYAKVAQIKAVNPSAKVLVYKNLGAVSRHGAGPHQPSVVTYQQVQANPGWALHDTNGSTIYWTDFGGYLQPIDPGDPGVIAASTQALVDECKARGFDGIYLDDMNADWTHDNTGASAPVDLTGGTVFESTRTWVAAVVPRLRSAGLQVVGNAQINLSSGWAEVLTTWATYLDGVNLEHWSRWGDYSSSQWPNFTGWMFEQRMLHAAAIQSKGAYLLGTSYGDAGDVAGQRYHRAMFLLMSNGAGYSMWCPSNYVGSFDAPAALVNLGAPKSPAEKLPGGLWKRAFKGGFIVVNPTDAARTWSRKSIWFGSDTSTSALASADAAIQRW